VYVYQLTARGKVAAVILALVLLLAVTLIFYSVLGGSGSDPRPGDDDNPPLAEPSSPGTDSPSPAVTGGAVLSPSASPSAEISLTPIPVPTAESAAPTVLPSAESINWSKRSSSILFDPETSYFSSADEAAEILKKLLCDDEIYTAPDLDGWLLVAEAVRYGGEESDVQALDRARSVTRLLTEELGIPQERVLPIASDKTGESASVSVYFIKSGSDSYSK
jgi:hypothetical protein